MHAFAGDSFCNRCSVVANVLLPALWHWISDKLSYLEKLRNLIRQKQQLDATLEEKSTAAHNQAITHTALRAARKFQKASPRFTRRREIASTAVPITLDVPVGPNSSPEVGSAKIEHELHAMWAMIEGLNLCAPYFWR